MSYYYIRNMWFILEKVLCVGVGLVAYEVSDKIRGLTVGVCAAVGLAMVGTTCILLNMSYETFDPFTSPAAPAAPAAMPE